LGRREPPQRFGFFGRALCLARRRLLHDFSPRRGTPLKLPDPPRSQIAPRGQQVAPAVVTRQLSVERVDFRCHLSELRSQEHSLGVRQVKRYVRRGRRFKLGAQGGLPLTRRLEQARDLAATRIAPIGLRSEFRRLVLRRLQRSRRLRLERPELGDRRISRRLHLFRGLREREAFTRFDQLIGGGLGHLPELGCAFREDVRTRECSDRSAVRLRPWVGLGQRLYKCREFVAVEQSGVVRRALPRCDG